jgi:hypothetical protein
MLRELLHALDAERMEEMAEEGEEPMMQDMEGGPEGTKTKLT